MLIITRHPGERIMLGEDIVVEVLEVAGSTVRVGIQAPRSIPVYREEIWERRNVARRSSVPTTASNVARRSSVPTTEGRSTDSPHSRA